MKKVLFFAAAAIAMLASCSQNDDLTATKVAEAKQTPVEIGVYLGNTAQTRATGGANGPITSAQVLAQKSGFGVFGYYTIDKDYLGTVKEALTPATPLSGTPATDLTTDQAAAIAPNFMYNQHVTGSDVATPVWTYSPIKYWPNGNTTADDQDNNAGTDPAKGTVGGKVSFFAYAPYWDKSAATDGIIAMSNNDATGNPTITYKLATDGTAVDLLWGTAGTNGIKAQEGSVSNNSWYIAKTPATPAWSDNPYKVNANLTKMKTDGKIQFNFKHALAKVGGSQQGTGKVNGLMIVADLDQNGNESGNDFETGTVDGVAGTKLTKITVSSIVISNDIDDDGDFDADDKAVATANKGTLDLATGQWTLSTDPDDKTAINHTIDATGAAPNAKLATAIAETTAPASGTKDDFFKCTSTWASQTGVPALHPINVYNTETNPFVFIPGTTPVLRFKITYIVRTYDANLANGFSEVTQTVSKKVTFSEAIKLNKMYNILIHLGMTSVKFDAIVSNWDVTDTDADSDGVADADQNVYLPINVSD